MGLSAPPLAFKRKSWLWNNQNSSRPYGKTHMFYAWEGLGFLGILIASLSPLCNIGSVLWNNGSLVQDSQRRQWHPTPVLLPGKSHGWRSLVGCSPWGREESDTTEQLHFHFPLSCIGEGNGNPLQCSCLENPRDRGAWWLPSMGSHRVGHDWSDLAAAAVQDSN